MLSKHIKHTYGFKASPQRDESSFHFKNQALSPKAPGFNYVAISGDDHQPNIADKANNFGGRHRFLAGNVAKSLVRAQADWNERYWS